MIYIGTELKVKVTIEAGGFDMNRDNFTIDVKRKNSNEIIRHFEKSDLLQIDNGGGWFMLLDSSELGTGTICAVVTAYVPDEDFKDGFRKEVQKVTLFNVTPV